MIHFHNVRWQNFLSSGNNWTEIQLDRSPNTLVVGENGAGKSTMLDALCFSLFGKPFRKINIPQLINSVNQKALMVEVNFTIGSTEYRVVRGEKPKLFEIYKDGNLINQVASRREYQVLLEQNILKLNYNSFTQIVILGSSTFVPFMQLPAQQRRDIIEDLLDIKIFTTMNVLLKERLSDNKLKITDVKNALMVEDEKLNVHENYIHEIETKNRARIANLMSEVDKSESSISRLEISIESNNANIKELQDSITDEESVNKKLQDILKIESKFDDKIKKIRKDIKFFEDNNVCPTCDQDIDKTIKDAKITQGKNKVDEVTNALDKLQVELNKENQRLLDIAEVNKEIQEYLTKVTDENNQISSLNRYIKQMRESIDTEVSDSTDLKAENNKLRNIKKGIEALEKKRKEHINEKELLDVAFEMLRDKGIKTQIVRQYIPVMNKLVNKYLAAMEFFVSFELDEKFEETIKSRHRDSFSYSSFSEGEKMRIDLSLLLTWRSIAKMKNSTNTNLLILDEVFDASLDSNGCDEFLKLLNELGQDTNIFVISHKGDILQDKFRSVIRFEKHKNFSRIAT
jgi:DNA repair exonuclease SbcCD ATPase subunit|tara:strand:+ start:489 stop:2204 length:1716 start_codon:yes stop_codon:yes gene_type:complete